MPCHVRGSRKIECQQSGVSDLKFGVEFEYRTHLGDKRLINSSEAFLKIHQLLLELKLNKKIWVLVSFDRVLEAFEFRVCVYFTHNGLMGYWGVFCAVSEASACNFARL